MRVLIAEDNAVERIMLQRFVEELGHECLVAPDGAAAWELFVKHGADVLVSDWMMPRMDGPELCRRVRAHAGAPYTYVILVTVLDDQEHTRHGLEAGADIYLAKPLQIDALELCLIAAARVSHLHQQLWRRDTQREDTHAALLRLCQQVAVLGDQTQLLTLLLAEATVLVAGTAGVITAWDEQHAALAPLHSTIPVTGGETAREAAQQASAGAARRGAPVILNAVRAPLADQTGSPPVVAVPLIHADRLVGALAIVSFSATKRFTPDDARLLHRLATIAAAGLAGLDRAQAARAQVRGPGPTYALPSSPTHLIGRDAELAHACNELMNAAGCRLVTLTGPAGVGKTRLALAAAARVADGFADGTVWVDLAALTESAMVVPTIGHALGVQADCDSEGLQAVLRDCQLLLILDTFEHVLEAAPEVARLLTACPRLKVLVTSRASLHLRAEQVIPVQPLAVPDLTRTLDVDELARSPALALFVDRAQAALPGFMLTPSTSRAVAEVCARLEGLPLGIELAGARSTLLSPQALLDRLEHPLDLLTSADRDRPERHQSLRQAIAWSYALLSSEDQHLFRQLAVFAGGFSLEAAAAVQDAARKTVRSADQESVLEGVGRLLDKNLLYVAASVSQPPRFRMLETIRAYANEQLDACAERADAWRAQVAFCLDLAQRAEPALRGADQVVWLDRLDREEGNLQAALRTVVATDDADSGLQLTGLLAAFWQMRGDLATGRDWLTRALSMAPGASEAARAPVLTGATRLAIAGRDWSAAIGLGQASLQAWRALTDRRGVAEAMADLAVIHSGQGARSRETRVLARESGAMARELGEPWTQAYVACCLGEVAFGYGNYAAARGHFEESLRLARQVGDQWRLAIALEGLAVVAAAEGSAARAVRLGGAAAGVRDSLRTPLVAASQEWFDRRLAVARGELGEERMAMEWAHGRALSSDELLPAALDADAVGGHEEVATSDQLRWLTRRELDVTALVALGLHNYEIGDRLGITRHTAEVHVSKILAKLGMASRAQLAAWAVTHGLLRTTR